MNQASIARLKQQDNFMRIFLTKNGLTARCIDSAKGISLIKVKENGVWRPWRKSMASPNQVSTRCANSETHLELTGIFDGLPICASPDAAEVAKRSFA